MEITIHWRKGSGFRVVPVNGAWGGPTPRGDVKVYFFHEGMMLPESIKCQVTPDGDLGKEIERTPPTAVEREFVVGMVLSPDQAGSIGRWLQEKARHARGTLEGSSENEEGDGEPDDVLTTQ